MRRMLRVFVSAALLLGAGSLRIEAAEVTYASGPDTVHGYLALPAGGPAKHPGLIVIHEWWGLNDWARQKADKFARDGYVALAVDLYRGKAAGTDSGLAHELMRGMPEDRAVRDLRAAFEYLSGRSDVDPSRIGSIGWCMGGGYSLATALAVPKLSACAIYYGRLVTDPAAIARIHAPLLGNFGQEDQGIPPESVKAFEAQAKKAGLSVDFKIYPACGHAFASSSDPKVFRAAEARDADARTDAFFAKYLKKG